VRNIHRVLYGNYVCLLRLKTLVKHPVVHVLLDLVGVEVEVDVELEEVHEHGSCLQRTQLNLVLPLLVQVESHRQHQRVAAQPAREGVVQPVHA